MTSASTPDGMSSLAIGGDGEEVCYLCFDGGVDDLDQPSRRECACRGTDAGFVHLSCLAKYAASISLQAHTAKEAIKPWEICPGCHQKYQHQLRIDITTEFVSFIRKQYPRDTQKQVEEIQMKNQRIDVFSFEFESSAMVDFEYLEVLNGVVDGNKLHTDNVVKVIVIGDVAVGKSKLVERYMKGDYDPRRLTTPLSLYRKAVAIDKDNDKSTVTVDLWDTAGE